MATYGITVEEADELGNDEADVGADEGACAEQQDLSTAANKYATRQCGYKASMARMQLYISQLRKMQREKIEAIEKSKTLSEKLTSGSS